MFKLLTGNSRFRLDETGLVQRQGRGINEWIDIAHFISGSKDYPSVKIDGKQMFVHRLVASMFVPNPEPTEFIVVHHIDENVNNCHADNLRWMSQGAHIGLHLLDIQRSLHTKNKTKQVMIGVRSSTKDRLAIYKDAMTFDECINYLLDVVEVLERK